jgi:uncharacterized membrane protein YbhN (UPF0104 family)
VLAVVAVVALLSRKGELAGASASFHDLRILWLFPALVGEALSVICFSAMMSRLLREADNPLAPGTVLGITLASNAVANSLPAGPAFGAAYSFRQMRRRSVPPFQAAWAVLASGIIASAGLALLAASGVAASLGQGSALGLVGVTLGAVTVAGSLVLLIRRPGLALRPARPVLSLLGLLGHRQRWEAAWAKFGRQLESVTPSWPGLLLALGWALGNWVLDLVCLICAFPAVGSAVPWRGVVLAYGAGQLAANLPITPGGLGAVEGSLTIALVAYGGSEASSVAAVIIYRLVSFWLTLLCGWGAAGVIALRARARPGPQSQASGQTGSAMGGRP